MTNLDNADPKKSGLLLIDMQEKLVPLIERSGEILDAICKLGKGASLFNVPIFVTEQVRLGNTVCPIKGLQVKEYFTKSTFSCLDDEKIKHSLLSLDIEEWLLCGIEAHICVLQTAKSLLKKGKRVTLLNDAIGSRSIFDFSTSIAELRDAGARISSTEIILFEWLKDSQTPEFKEMLPIIKETPHPVV